MLVLDSGGLTAIARNDQRARAALLAFSRAGAPVVLPAVVIAESTRAAASDALVNRVVRAVDVVSTGEAEAREAARLKRLAGMSGVEQTIDALVVAAATLAGGGAVLTSDPDDIEALAAARPDVRVRAIRV